jgi:glyoxylase-like metal-dependent hydrolase (beta-lactamase superfamily II)
VSWLVALLLASTPANVPTAVEIAPHVFVRDVGGHGLAGSNQVFVVFDSFVVVFDPGTVAEAHKLLREIRARTDKPIRHVIASHFHPDHSAGASVFAAVGAEIVAAESARDAFRDWVPDDFAEKARSEPAVYRGLTPVVPSRWVDGRWAIDDGTQRLELMYLGHGHTSGDLIGWMPRQRILLSQDLSPNGQHNLGNANISVWIGILAHLRELEPRLVVPGHKAVGGPEILDKSFHFLTELRAQARRMVADGQTYEQVLKKIDIPMYEQWSGRPMHEQRLNVMRAFQQAGGTVETSQPLLTPRRLAYAGGLVWLALATIVVLREYRQYLPPYPHAHAFPAPRVQHRAESRPSRARLSEATN